MYFCAFFFDVTFPAKCSKFKLRSQKSFKTQRTFVNLFDTVLDAVNCWNSFRGFEKRKHRARNTFTNTTTTQQCILNLSVIRTMRSCTGRLYLSKWLLSNISAVWFGMPLPPKSALLANNSVQHWAACICNMGFGEKCCQAIGLDMMIFVLFVANFSILHFSTISIKGTGASTAKIRPHACQPHAVLPKIIVICLILDLYICTPWNLHSHLFTLNLLATTNTLTLLLFALEPG